ncbi:DinB family protein [Alkalihalobacillus sp. AL-G]|uniref:DinB family protein n=1 Tax=Alkalihalobacillus sp. AL-G TaxID=2926399 RepID=UPI00272C431C|nr:DinB family protein [Alkalihalobacillus sp. AL-G]WLD94728.1 DinB family protein [Alkalihalobacillus sp. AL-G]
MSSIDLLILNLEEVRRRSIKVWSTIPDGLIGWRPDSDALSCIEMVRHVLDGEHYYHLAIVNRGSLADYESPFDQHPLVSVEKELEFAKPYREKFIETVRTCKEDDLQTIKIDRSDVGYIRTLGDMLLRIAYHESVHTGQLLDYLRTAHVPRVNVWD